MASNTRISKRLQKSACKVNIEEVCRSKVDQEGFVKAFINPEIGYGVFATKEFEAGDFLLEYPGELITQEEAERRENTYQEQNKGCFLYQFMFEKTRMCIDGTLDERLGKFVNDSPPSFSNAKVKVETVNDRPHLCIFAIKNIESGTEIRN